MLYSAFYKKKEHKKRNKKRPTMNSVSIQDTYNTETSVRSVSKGSNKLHTATGTNDIFLGKQKFCTDSGEKNSINDCFIPPPQ